MKAVIDGQKPAGTGGQPEGGGNARQGVPCQVGRAHRGREHHAPARTGTGLEATVGWEGIASPRVLQLWG